MDGAGTHLDGDPFARIRKAFRDVSGRLHWDLRRHHGICHCGRKWMSYSCIQVHEFTTIPSLRSMECLHRGRDVFEGGLACRHCLRACHAGHQYEFLQPKSGSALAHEHMESPLYLPQERESVLNHFQHIWFSLQYITWSTLATFPQRSPLQLPTLLSLQSSSSCTYLFPVYQYPPRCSPSSL